MSRKSRRRWLAAAIVVAASLAWTAAAGAAGSGTLVPAIQGPALTSATSQGCVFAPSFVCYGPYELGKAYDFPTGLDGSGSTIVIVDAYGSPTLQQDLALFDSYFGVPAPPSLVVDQAAPARNSSGGSGDVFDWGIETSLDVEYAHAMAPGARIVLVVAASDNNDDINAAEARFLPRYPGAVVSQSFGDWETDPTAGDSFSQQHRIFELATRERETIVASSGDAGATWTPYTGTTSPAIASYPASDPLVTAVGGTMGLPYPGGLLQNGAYGGEQVWNEPQFDAAGGGAPSILFRAPSYQYGVTGNRARTEPDVAYNAAIDGGVQLVYSCVNSADQPTENVDCSTPHIWLVGGTSAGSPQWAAVFAIADQMRGMEGRPPLGFANDLLYQIGRDQFGRDGGGDHHSAPAFHDIVTGTNALDSSVGFSAAPGYDLASGWGTPDVANLVSDLATMRIGRMIPFFGPGRPGRGDEPNGPRGGHRHPHTMAPGQ